MINFNKRNIHIITLIITTVLFMCIQFIFNNHYEFKPNINSNNQSIFILSKNLNPKEIVNQLSKNKNSKKKNQDANNKKQNSNNIK